MRYLNAIILAFLIFLFSSYTILQTGFCYSHNPSSELVDNVYSSVVLITHKKIKTSIWDILSFALLAGGTAAGIGGVGQVLPGHIDKTVGTGFQTKWGIVTNSHVMDDKSKVVLTTFFKRNYRIKKINRVISKDQHISFNEAKIIQATSKEATVYDWGGIGIDLALIHVNMPMAVKLPLAREVNIGEKVFTLGHPESKKFTPAIGRLNRIYNRGRTKYMELSIENAPGSSGSPVLNMNGEVVGVLWGSINELVGEAVHVEELRKAFGLPIYDMSKKEYTTTKEHWSGAVYSTENSRLFHLPECVKLNSLGSNLIEFPSKEVAIRDGGKPCPLWNP